jgi:hypothetical protein
MILGACIIDLSIPASHSLKDKRGVLKPLVSQLRREFNVSVAEVDDQDVWRSATIAVAMVSSDGGNVHGTLEEVVRWIERTQPHITVTNWDIEVL